MRNTPPKNKDPFDPKFSELDPLMNVGDLLENEMDDDMEGEYGNPDENDEYAG